MPLDYRIAGSVKVPDWTPQAQLEEDAAKSESLRASRQAAIEDAKDKAAIVRALQMHIGEDGKPDFDGAIKSLYPVSPRAASMLESQYTKLREDAAKQHKADLDNDTLTAKLLAQAAEGVVNPDGTVDPTRYEMFRQHAGRIDPETQKYLGDTPDPKIIGHFVSAGTEVAEANKLHKEATDHFLNGDWQKALGMSLPLVTTQEDVDQLFAQARANGMPKDIYDAYPKDLTPENKARWAQMALTEPQREQMADMSVGRDLQRSQQEQTKAYQTAELGIQQQNANTSRMQAQTAAKRLSLSGDSAADAESVAGYVRQVKTGTMPLLNVPAAGGMRNAVVKALEKEGVNVQKLTAADLTRKNVAKTIIPKITEAQQLATEIDHMGLTGSIGGRWRSLVSGESSASSLSGLTDDQKRKVGKFVTVAQGLLESGIAMAHGGARGGGSPQLLEMIKKYLDPGNKELPVYLGNLDGAMEFMQSYAQMGEAEPTTGTSAAASASAGVPKEISDLLKDKPPLVYHFKGPDGAVHDFQKFPDGTIRMIK